MMYGKKIENASELIQALEIMAEYTDEVWLETHKRLQGGAYTMYRWSLSPKGDDYIMLEYMGEFDHIHRQHLNDVWDDEYSNMWSVIEDPQNITRLGGSRAWVKGVDATAFTIDARIYEAAFEDVDDSPCEAILASKVLAPVKADLSGLVDAVGDITPDELVSIMEIARVAMCDAAFFDDMASAMDIEDDSLVRLRDKLQRHMDGLCGMRE